MSQANSDVSKRLHAARQAYGIEHVPTLRDEHRLPARCRDAFAHMVHTLWPVLCRQQRGYFAAPHSRLSLPEGAQRYITAVASDPVLLCCRFDVLVTDADTPRIHLLEVQAGDPSGAAWTDVLAAARPARNALLEHDVGRLMQHHARTLRHAYDQWCMTKRQTPRSRPRVAFLCERDAFVRSDHNCAAALYRGLGWDAFVIAPDAVKVRNGAPFCAHGPIDIVVRDTIDDFVLEPAASRLAAFRALVAEDRIFVMNPFADTLLDDKRHLAHLHRFAHTDVERDVLKRFLPETHVVDATRRDALINNKAGWVLKPADGYGGFGITVGAHCDDDVWSAAVAEAERTPTVMQAFVDVAPQPVAMLGDAKAAPRYLTYSAWCHGGRFSGAYVRAGDRPVVNVHQGGGIAPVAFGP